MIFFFSQATGYGCPDRWEPVRRRVCKDGVVNREGDSAYGWVNHESSGGQISRRRRGGGLSGPLRAWDGDGGADMNLMSGAWCRVAFLDGYVDVHSWMDGCIQAQGKVEQEESLSC